MEQLSSGGRAQGNGLRLRPLNIKQPMVVVQPLNERAPNQKSPQKDGANNHLAPPEPTDPPPGAEDEAKAGAAAAVAAPAETGGKAEQIFRRMFQTGGLTKIRSCSTVPWKRSGHRYLDH